MSLVFSERCCGAGGVPKFYATRGFCLNRMFIKFSTRVANRNRWDVKLTYAPFEPPRTDCPNQSAASNPIQIELFERSVEFSIPRFISNTK